jgi:hypothetical protein
MITDLPSPEGGRVLNEMLFFQPLEERKAAQTPRTLYRVRRPKWAKYLLPVAHLIPFGFPHFSHFFKENHIWKSCKEAPEPCRWPPKTSLLSSMVSVLVAVLTTTLRLRAIDVPPSFSPADYQHLHEIRPRGTRLSPRC